jgi:hypothetical protein
MLARPLLTAQAPPWRNPGRRPAMPDVDQGKASLMPGVAHDSPGRNPEQDDELPWVSVTEAARLTGLHIEAIRGRIRRGRVEARKNNAGSWLVRLPIVNDLGGVQGGEDGALGNIQGEAGALSELWEELAELRVRLARAEAGREASIALARAEAEIRAARAEERAQASERIISEMQRLLTEAQQPWL